MKSTQDKIICLGKEFTTDDERREYYRNELRTKLPELKKIEGFPIGEDEDIINLSDPPYYTSCPNPWLNDFIVECEKKKEKIPGRKKDFQVNEPYASDVSVGKNNPVYNLHSYHTKVPHPAIMRYILHYTEPGDIVFDGFSGTGMTGVAAQMCSNPDNILKYQIEQEFKEIGGVLPQWGIRKAIISDISPIASFIAYNSNISIDIHLLETEILALLEKVDEECGWMYETLHTNDKKGKINYTIWSEVFTCPICKNEIVFWERAIDAEAGEVKDEFNCQSCNALNTKKILDKKWITVYDQFLKQPVKQVKNVPVVINYTYNNKRYEKKPDANDLLIIEKINNLHSSHDFDVFELPKGDKMGDPFGKGITYAHQFFTMRNLFSLLAFLGNSKNSRNKILITAIASDVSKMARVKVGYYFKGGGGPFIPGLSGTFYVPSLSVEKRVEFACRNRLKTILSSLPNFNDPSTLVMVNSATDLHLMKPNSVDYIFTDPPFGANIMYSELNILTEYWLKVRTNNKDEAIENKNQSKNGLDYQNLMATCFSEYYKILKPGKWMTVEFSNTSAAVWNGIQTALQKAGFIIANVAALDKKQGSFNAVSNPTSVKQDLVISCYKPSAEFESSFKALEGDIAVWDFVSEHLHHLPVHFKKDNSTTAIIERSPKIIFDRLVTFYFMRGLVPIDARDFQDGLRQRFIERDGMYFSSEQAAEYDAKKSLAPQFVQLSLIVASESDAIEWLKDRLRKQTQKYQDIMPDFRIATQSLRKGDTLPELQNILNESFIQDSDGKWRTPDPNEAKDREALRTKVLLKEFNGYSTGIGQPKAKKLKEVRVEALRAGFKNCWEQKDFKTIVTVGDMIPQNILLEDEQLLMYYDIAKDRV